MRVRAAMLFDGLSKIYHCSCGLEYTGSAVVETILLDEEANNYSKNALVFRLSQKGDMPEVVNVPAARVVLVVGFGEPIPEDAPCAFYVRADSAAIDEVIASARNVLAKYRNWGDRLLDIVLSDLSLRDLVNAAHPLLGNPIIVIDRELKALANTSEDRTDDDMWVDTEAAEAYIDTSAYAEVDVPALFHELKTKPSISRYPIHDNKHMSVCLTKEGEEGSAIVCLIEKNRTITEGDDWCLKHLSSLAGVLFDRLECADVCQQNKTASLYADILSGNITKRESALIYIRNFDLRLAPRYHVIVIFARKAFLNERQMHKIADELQDIVVDGVVLKESQSLIVVVNNDSDSALHRADAARLATFLARSDAIGAISEPSDKVLELHHLRDQAFKAAHIGLKVWPERSLYFYADCRPYSVFETCVNADKVENYLHPCLLRLKTRDALSNLPLMPTLKCLVDNDGNQVATARQLNVQRNTLRYRIEKIEEICSIDLRNPELFFQLELSFKLLDYCTLGE